ncbi:MAG: hypothetical protein JO247_03320 [Chloroflexi bacterium]|nr:hypothetical protein [Chloroflexota bacterium]
MKFPQQVAACALAGAIAWLSLPAAADAASAAARDGSHDFDFNYGTWTTHIKRVLEPFSPASGSVEETGTVSVRKVWEGRAWLEEIEVDGPKGHWEGATLFVYNPEAHQWTQTYVSGKTGTFEPPTIGSFKDGRGELYAQDTDQGRSILVRGVWSDIQQDSHSYVISYSDDGGKTWVQAFSAHLTRQKS